MKHIVCFSGGKDSTALILWAKENLPEFDTVFCDTGWEQPITYAYVEEINQQLLGGKLIRLKSKKYPDGFVQLTIDKKMIPNSFARFCTQELKVFPLHEYFAMQDDEITSYQGIRADESATRKKMGDMEWVDDAGGYTIKRPLLNWSAADCFTLMKKHAVRPNPLYLMGAVRVGCWPCIMVGLRELKAALSFHPEIRNRVINLENQVNGVIRTGGSYRAFFKSDDIPSRFCSLTTTKDDGRTVPIATAKDVFDYIESTDKDQIPLLPARNCMSVYNLCE